MNINANEQTSTSYSQFRVMPTASGHNLLLSAEDYPVYHLHITRFITELRPADQWEAELVQRIADNEWRIDRITRLEMGLFARGALEFANLYAEEDSSIRTLLIQAHTHTAYVSQFNNLSNQESRLRRYVEKDLAELRQRQADRLEREADRQTMAAAATAASSSRTSQRSRPTASKPNGFEFAEDRDKDSSSLESELITYGSNGKVTRH